uniref:Uncharacterized protein n=1 Tax=Romanomermis culicivorax TaxID=13658 RepID=A0A915J1P8_ROMCU
MAPIEPKTSNRLDSFFMLTKLLDATAIRLTSLDLDGLAYINVQIVTVLILLRSIQLKWKNKVEELWIILQSLEKHSLAGNVDKISLDLVQRYQTNP